MVLFRLRMAGTLCASGSAARSPACSRRRVGTVVSALALAALLVAILVAVIVAEQRLRRRAAPRRAASRRRSSAWTSALGGDRLERVGP